MNQSPSNPSSQKPNMMNQNIILSCILCSPLIIHSYIIILLISLITTTTTTTAQSFVDPNYLACKPQTCGNNLTISYPFYIQGRQEPYCGFPGFGITCSRDGFPILNLSNTQYIIHQIFYENASFRVSNAVFSRWATNTTACLSPTQNLTLPSNNRFHIGQNIKDIRLFYDCDLSLLPREMEQYSIGCSAGNGTSSVMTLNKDDKNLTLVAKGCRGEVVDAVVMKDGNNNGGGGGGKGIEEELRRGFLMNWTASDCNMCSNSGGRCGFDSTIYTFRCYCTDRPHASNCALPVPATHEKIGKTVLIVTTVSSVVVALLLLLVCCFRRKLFAIIIGALVGNKHLPTDEMIIELFLKQHGSLPARRYNYSEIKKCTNHFNVKLGQGGYGSVYKGSLPDGRLVAVKVLSELKGTGEEFINEVASISRTSHVNIVTLVGFCFQGSKRALIYEFMSNGSLEKFIYEEDSAIAGRQLDCKTLYDIVIGVARGLDYLHRGCNT